MWSSITGMFGDAKKDSSTPAPTQVTQASSTPSKTQPSSKPNPSDFMFPNPNIDQLDTPVLKTNPSSLPHVGYFEMMDNRSNDVTLIERSCFTGLQLSVRNILGQNFQSSHQVNLGKKEGTDPMTGQKDGERASYTFQAMTGKEPWQMQASVSANSSLAFLLYEKKYPGRSSIMSKFIAQSSKGQNQYEFEVGGIKGDSTAQFKIQGGQAIGLTYTQPVDKLHSFGAELLIFGPTMAHNRFILKRDNKQANTSGTISISHGGPVPTQVTSSYVAAIIPNLDSVSQLDLTFNNKSKQWDSVFRFGYSLQGPMGASVKALATSQGRVVCQFEQPMSDMLSVSASGKIDYTKNVYDFGVGLTTGF